MARLATAKYRAKLKAARLCVNCGQRRPANRSRALCNFCLRKIKEKRQAFVQQGVCHACGKRKPEKGRPTCTFCRKRTLGYGQVMYRRRRNRLLCTECENPALPNHRLCASCFATEKQRGLALRLETFIAYGGPKCVCCGNDVGEFLTLEHPDNDGGRHRRELGGKGGQGFYRKLKHLGFPQSPRMVVMCWNCNFARNCFGYCPCQRKRAKPNNE